MPDFPKSLKFVVTTWEGGGSVGPALTVARKLVDAGHDVRVMSDACNRPEAEASGARFVAWTRAPSRTDRNRESELTRDWAGGSISEGLSQALIAVSTGPAHLYAEDLLEELRREPADLVVGSELIAGVPLGCEVAGQPCAMLSCNSIIFPVKGGPRAGPPMSPEQTEAMRAVLEQLALACDIALPHLNRARAHFGLPALDDMLDQFHVARKTLIGVSRTFDFGPAIDPPGFAYVGPQLDEVAWAGAWQSPWPEGYRPLVLVGFSTTFQNHAGVLQRVIDALAGQPVNAVVTLGPAILPEELRAPDNVRLLRSAPHGEVMREASLVVTHGGHGTVARAMVARLPMLVIPHGRDQDGNAARIAAHGAGLMLPPSAAEEEIAQAIEALLTDPAYAEAAQRLGAAVEREMRESRVVEELEALVCPAYA